MNRNTYSIIVILIFIISGCDNSEMINNNLSSSHVDSVAVLTDLIHQDSLNSDLFLKRAKINLNNGKVDPALRDLQSALKISPNNPQLFILLSEVYFVLGQKDNSIASLKKAIRLNPENITAYLKLSETYLLINKADVAIKYADEAVNKNPKSGEAYYMKAMCLLELEDTTSAINNLRISAKLSPDNYMTYMQLGVMYVSRNDTLSKSVFEKALSIKPNDERALYYLGMYFQEHGENNKALQKFKQLTDYHPENSRAYYNMGYIYLVELNSYDTAKIMFQKAVELRPSFVEAVYNLGRTYEILGQYEDARIKYKKALELLPNYPLAVQGMNRLDEIMIRGNTAN